MFSRHISKLVYDGMIIKIKASKNILVPSCCFYEDDILVLTSRGANLQALKNLFTRYAFLYIQWVNPTKLTLFHGIGSHSRVEELVNLT